MSEISDQLELEIEMVKPNLRQRSQNKIIGCWGLISQISKHLSFWIYSLISVFVNGIGLKRNCYKFLKEYTAMKYATHVSPNFQEKGSSNGDYSLYCMFYR